MKKFRLNKLVPVGISLLTFAGFVGSISGSLAWWAYSTRVSASYQGTSVSTSEQLQIGLKLDVTKFDTDAKVKTLTDLGLVEDTPVGETEYRYVFAKAGGGLSAPAIRTYLETEGMYATDELVPITSRSYNTGDVLSLRESLIAGNPQNAAIADTSKYVKIPFLFRIVKLNAVSTDDLYAGGRRIFLSKVKAEADSHNPDSTIANALRVYFNNGTPGNSFILNPSDTSNNESGQTYVCGLLDIGGEPGYYDVDPEGKEILYGDYTGGLPATGSQTTAPTEMSDVNGVGANAATLADMTKFTTFLAAHKQGTTTYPSLEDVEDGFTKGKQVYKTMKAIAPDATSAVLSGGEPLCETAESGNHLAELETVIWMEGWDHSIIDQQNSHKFNLGLQFQIDLVS